MVAEKEIELTVMILQKTEYPDLTLEQWIPFKNFCYDYYRPYSVFLAHILLRQIFHLWEFSWSEE